MFHERPPQRESATDGAEQVPSEPQGKKRGDTERSVTMEQQREQSPFFSFCLSLFHVATHRGIMARRLGQPLIHFHPTMQHATTPQQLPLGWNRCQSTYASSAPDAASSAVKTMMAVLRGDMGVGGSVYKHPWHSDSIEEIFIYFLLMVMLINAEKDEEMEGSLIIIKT